MQDGDPLALAYTTLVAETTAAFHAAIPESQVCSLHVCTVPCRLAQQARLITLLHFATQVSVDFAWSPNGIDGRWFDWRGLAAAADLVFVMGYDTQSQALSISEYHHILEEHSIFRPWLRMIH